MEISKMLTISTAHISKETAKLLDMEPNNDNIQLSVYSKSDWGWFIFIRNDFESHSIPNDLLKCLKFAKNLGCDWLCLDCDGEEVNDLNTYRW